MMLTHFLIVFLSLLVSRGEGKTVNAEVTHWGLIVAGSNSWYNYRHQADACHAYQILHKNGIPDKNIVVMMYDDIAHNKQNPTQGIIINKPNGTDVYHGVPKDHTKTDVTPKNFLNILKGNKAAMQGIGSGKVIESGPNDHVFVYFTDHGAPGLVAFPSGTLMASDLNDAIKYMYIHKKYQKMVFYIEACESGSIFNKLLKSNINVYATTAATPDQPSYACYYSSKYQTYLGDVYSVKWMENSDKVDVSKESLLKQFTVVKKETTTSQVMKYGDMAWLSLSSNCHFLKWMIKFLCGQICVEETLDCSDPVSSIFKIGKDSCACDNDRHAGALKFVEGLLMVCLGNRWAKAELNPKVDTYGTELNPGESCKDIKSKLSGSPSDGLYWIKLPSDDGGLPVYCDMKGGGWTLVLKFISGIPEVDPFGPYHAELPSAEFLEEAISLTNDYKNHYKHRLAIQKFWNDFPKERVGITTENRTVFIKR
ncbi:legumain-like isoform X3 [Acropora muricata]|uniref:legumain-like isoform X3 n=1 Tax=Acropora muricata TaxID=159855 RepID=UPI0034E3E38B